MTGAKRKLRGTLRLTVKIGWWCVVGLLVILLVSIFGAKISGKVPNVFGYSVVNIISTSMEDEIPKGSYILIKKVEPEKVKKDDVICFYSTDPRIYGVPNTHRVVEEPVLTEDGIEFVTKGDAAPKEDPVTAKGENLIGVYVRTLDGLTAFSNALEGNTLIIIIILLQMGIAAMFVFTAVRAKNKNAGEDKK